HADVHLVALALEPLEPGDEARIAIAAPAAFALDDRALVLLAELAPGAIEGNALPLAERPQHAPLPRGLGAVPGTNGAPLERQALVGDHLAPVDSQHAAEAAALRAGAQRRLIGKQPASGG